MSPAENHRRRAAITIAVVVAAVAIVALLLWIGFNVFAGDVLQCYTPKDDHTFTPVCP